MFFIGTSSAAGAAPTSLFLAQNHVPLLPIVIGRNAGAPTIHLANTLKDMLNRIVTPIAGQEFRVITGTSDQGLAVGLPKEFPELDPAGAAPVATFPFTNDVWDQDRFVFRLHTTGAYLLGATDFGASNAVWKFLHKLGYRQFLPSSTWEVVPALATIDLNAYKKFQGSHAPQSKHRSWITANVRVWDDVTMEANTDWAIKNTMSYAQTANLNSGAPGYVTGWLDGTPHGMAAIDDDPNVVIPKSTDGRPCSGEPLVTQEYIENYSARLSSATRITGLAGGDEFSGDTFDGCATVPQTNGDGILRMANDIVRDPRFTQDGIRLSAYLLDAEPPVFETADPKVYVEIPSSRRYHDRPFDETVSLWKAQGVTHLGRYGYFSSCSDRTCGLPVATENLMNPTALLSDRVRFSGLGIMVDHVEVHNYWSAYGPFLWAWTHFLWSSDVKNANVLLGDFYAKAFGPAATVMKSYYETLMPENHPYFAQDLISKLYLKLKRARSLASARPDVMARLDDLAIFTRFLDLYRRAHEETGVFTVDGNITPPTLTYDEMYALVARSKTRNILGYWDLFDFAEAITQDTYYPGVNTTVLDSYIYQELKSVNYQNVTTNEEFRTSYPTNDYTPAEVAALFAQGLAENPAPTLPAAIAFSKDLVPLAETPLAITRAVNNQGVETNIYPTQKIYVHPKCGQSAFTIAFMRGYADNGFGNFRVTLSAVDDPSEKVTCTTYDGTTSDSCSLSSMALNDAPGIRGQQAFFTGAQHKLYKLEFVNYRGMKTLDWDTGLPLSILAQDETDPDNGWKDAGYFLVPGSTDDVLFYKSSWNGSGVMTPIDPAAPTAWVTTLSSAFKKAFKNVIANPHATTTVWQLSAVRDAALLNVPPYVARHPSELLVPRETVESETGQAYEMTCP